MYRRRVWIIASASILAVIGLLASSYFLNSYALSNLQFRPASYPTLNEQSTASKIVFDVCNPTSIPASFDKFKTVFFYKDKELASLDLNGSQVNSNSIAKVEGTIGINSQIAFMLALNQLSGVFTGKSIGSNQDDMKVSTTFNAKLVDLIPYSMTKHLTTEEFNRLAGNRNIVSHETFSCG